MKSAETSKVTVVGVKQPAMSMASTSG